MSIVKPIFILSLQRSGSTLLQHILAQHPLISTYTEPWFLLPFLSAMYQDGIKANYNHTRAAEAIADFIGSLPGGVDQYYEELTHFTSRVYSAHCMSGTRFFLDKSPGYAFIARELVRCFAEAKFIFLWRNPLSVASSWLQSFDKGRWRIAFLAEELRVGLPLMVETYQEAKSRVFALRYEDLVTNPEHSVRAICTYLGVEYHDTMLKDDTTIQVQGIQEHQRKNLRPNVDTSSLNNWHYSFTNVFRNHWARRYMEWLGATRLSTMGYSMDHLLGQLPQQRFALKGVFSDMWWLLRDQCELHFNRHALR